MTVPLLEPSSFLARSGTPWPQERSGKREVYAARAWVRSAESRRACTTTTATAAAAVAAAATTTTTAVRLDRKSETTTRFLNVFVARVRQGYFARFLLSLRRSSLTVFFSLYFLSFFLLVRPPFSFSFLEDALTHRRGKHRFSFSSFVSFRLYFSHPSFPRHSPLVSLSRVSRAHRREGDEATHAHAPLAQASTFDPAPDMRRSSSCIGSRCAPVTASASDGAACALGAPPSNHPTIFVPPPPPDNTTAILLTTDSRHYHYYNTTTPFPLCVSST